MYETKVCKTCGMERPKDVFYKDRAVCKFCCNAARRAKYKLENNGQHSETVEEVENETQTAAYNIFTRINQYPPHIRQIMLKQAEMYEHGEYTTTTRHSTRMK